MLKKVTGFFSDLNADTKVYLVNLFLLFLIYWPITFLVYNFKWDMADQYVPWRHHIGLSIQNLEFPLWNAHHGGGYPIHADPQSGAFYPIVWILTLLFGGYSILTAHAEFFLTVFIASCCFYKLCRFFGISLETAMVAGLMYACSGIFIGNTQHITWLISGAYLPGIFYCFLALSVYQKYKYAIGLALILFLHLTGGYPGFDIILLYLLIIIFIYFLFIHFTSGLFLKYLLLCSLSAILTILFSSGFLYSIYYIAPYINRGAGISLELAMQNAFTIPSFLSFILPFATCKHQEIIGTDISMSNAYFGLFFILCLPVYIFKTQKTAFEKLMLVCGIICLLASVGEVLPVRKWLFYLPMMDYFRFPSAFRIFVVIFFLLSAAIQLDKQKNNPAQFRKIIFLTSGIFLLILLIAMVKNYSGTSVMTFFSNKSLFDQHSTVYDHIILQSIVQLFLLVLFLILSALYKPHFAKLLYCFMITDIIFSVHLNLPYTSLDFHSTPKSLNEKITLLPDITHIPSQRICLNSDNSQSLQPLWRNLQNYRLEIGYESYNPFELRTYDSLSQSPYFKTIIQNYPVYLASAYIHPPTGAHIQPLDSEMIQTHKIAVVDPNSWSRYQQRSYHPGDTCRIIAMSGNTITIKAQVRDTSTLVVFQNYLPGWRCNVNQKEEKIESLNISLMGVKIPPGESITKLEYIPTGIHSLTILNLISLLTSTFVLFFFLRKNI